MQAGQLHLVVGHVRGATAQFDPAARKKAVRAAKGLNASPGAAVGRAVFSADDAVAWVENVNGIINTDFSPTIQWPIATLIHGPTVNPAVLGQATPVHGVVVALG